MASVKISTSTASSVKAALAAPSKERTAQEKAYDALLEKCVYIESHVQKPADKARLYTVTTLASSPRFGGDRTPVVCDSFEIAKGIVERNDGDIWEASYDLVVIEAVLPNILYGCVIGEQYWYKWDHDAEAYRPIQCPPGKENIIGYGIG
jgi:hypothetical protein